MCTSELLITGVRTTVSRGTRFRGHLIVIIFNEAVLPAPSLVTFEVGAVVHGKDLFKHNSEARGSMSRVTSGRIFEKIINLARSKSLEVRGSMSRETTVPSLFSILGSFGPFLVLLLCSVCCPLGCGFFGRHSLVQDRFTGPQDQLLGSLS